MVVVVVVMIADVVTAIKLAVYIAVSDVRLPTMQATHVSPLSSSSCCGTTTNVMNGCSSSSNVY